MDNNRLNHTETNVALHHFTNILYVHKQSTRMKIFPLLCAYIHKVGYRYLPQIGTRTLDHIGSTATPAKHVSCHIHLHILYQYIAYTRTYKLHTVSMVCLPYRTQQTPH